MAESNNNRIVVNLLPVILVFLTASGILVNTLPLESTRPADSERIRMSHAGRQDVEARLWQDPFTVMQRAKGDTPEARCEDAKKDDEHHPVTLANSIERRNRNSAVTVLPVLVPGGPYFEDGESRRRARYAVVTALLNSGWEPSDEDKLGYIWTFESCIDGPWQRWAPEILPWEWFRRTSTNGEKEALLVLWVDDNVVKRRPLGSMREIVRTLALGGPPCSDSCPRRQEVGDGGKEDAAYEAREKALGKLAKELGACKPKGKPPSGDGKAKEPRPRQAKGCPSVDFPCPKQCWRPPWRATRVLGPWTSDGLQGLAREMKDDREHGPLSKPGYEWLRFYSSSATAATDERFWEGIKRRSRGGNTLDIEAVKTRLANRLLRLTTTDDGVAKAWVDELKRRLIDPNPFWRITHLGTTPEEALCDATVVIVAESDSTYAREFREAMVEALSAKCSRPGRVIAKSYLRGLDGVLPDGTGQPVASIKKVDNGIAQTGRETLLNQASRERADGRSQYDYLRRLAEDVASIERQEHRAGRAGIRAVGVLGNDLYDKILVMEALREQFRDAIFFTADLDARLIGAEVTKWTRNLVVASSYGLTLNPAIQGSAPPFRDTYQTGLYLSTLVALDRRTQQLKDANFDDWFKKPRLFEIGRTRAIPLPAGVPEKCDDTSASLPVAPGECRNPHPLDERTRFPWPHAFTWFALAVVLFAGGVLFLLLRAPQSMTSEIDGAAWSGIAGFGIATVVSLIFFYHQILDEVKSHDGEPFAWIEGVSIWPTVLLQLLAIAVIGALFWWYYVHKLSKDINGLKKQFTCQGVRHHVTEKSRPHGPWIAKIRSLWWLDSSNAANPWSEFVDRMDWNKRAKRVAATGLLGFLLSVALISLQWPNSPHRGVFSAWSHHITLLLTLLTLTLSLFAALDASAMVKRFMTRLTPLIDKLEIRDREGDVLGKPSLMDAQVIQLQNWFRMVVKIGEAVNGLIRLPVIALLLAISVRIRTFDAWTFPLPYWLLMALFTLLALFCAIRLRTAASAIKQHILSSLDQRIASHQAMADVAGSTPGRAPTADSLAQETVEWDSLPPHAKARRIKEIRDQVTAEHGGPFRRLPEDPIIQAILLLFGGTGGVATLHFLFGMSG